MKLTVLVIFSLLFSFPVLAGEVPDLEKVLDLENRFQEGKTFEVRIHDFSDRETIVQDKFGEPIQFEISGGNEGVMKQIITEEDPNFMHRVHKTESPFIEWELYAKDDKLTARVLIDGKEFARQELEGKTEEITIFVPYSGKAISAKVVPPESKFFHKIDPSILKEIKGLNSEILLRNTSLMEIRSSNVLERAEIIKDPRRYLDSLKQFFQSKLILDN